MWTLTLRDLAFRRRRFLIAIAGTALVFAMALIMSGMAEGFRSEVDTTLDAIGADSWVVTAGVAGPFTAFGTISEEALAEVAADPGVRQADPLIILRATVRREGKNVDVNVIGHRIAGLGAPPIVEGRPARAPGEAVTDRALRIGLGGRFTMQGKELTVVGRTDGLTYLAGVPVVAIPLADAQDMAYAGRKFMSAIVTRGVPTSAPAGLAVAPNSVARADMMRPLANGIKTIDNTSLLLWIVAATIIGAVVYLSAIERLRDFAVLKAVGASSPTLYGSLATQSMAIALVSAAIAAGLALALAPAFPLPITIPARAFAVLPAIALAVGFGASLSGLGRVIRTDPARAFGAP